MNVTANVYFKRKGRWRKIAEVTSDLDHNAGLGDDYGYLDFALRLARTYPAHRLVIGTIHHWNTCAVAGRPSVRKIA